LFGGCGFLCNAAESFSQEPRLKNDSAGERFRFGQTEDREREGASTVSLNHPLAVNPREAGETCVNCKTF
jgi:hypothetical protein